MNVRDYATSRSWPSTKWMLFAFVAALVTGGEAHAAGNRQTNPAGYDCVTKVDAPLPDLGKVESFAHFAGAMRVRQTWFCKRLVLTNEPEDPEDPNYKKAWWSFGRFDDNQASLASTLQRAMYRKAKGETIRVILRSGNDLYVTTKTGGATARYESNAPHGWATYSEIEKGQQIVIVD